MSDKEKESTNQEKKSTEKADSSSESSKDPKTDSKAVAEAAKAIADSLGSLFKKNQVQSIQKQSKQNNFSQLTKTFGGREVEIVEDFVLDNSIDLVDKEDLKSLNFSDLNKSQLSTLHPDQRKALSQFALEYRNELLDRIDEYDLENPKKLGMHMQKMLTGELGQDCVFMADLLLIKKTARYLGVDIDAITNSSYISWLNEQQKKILG